MKIIRADAIWIALPYEHGAPKPALSASVGSRRTQDAVYIRVETEDGLVGWGEGFGFAACSVTYAAFTRAVAPLAIGRDAEDIEGLMRDLNRRTQNMARNGPVAYALSGLDIALWDLAGKRQGRPLSELLGGARRARIPAYASLLRLETRAHIERVVTDALTRGYRAVKLHEKTEGAARTARDVLGPDIPLMVDVNCAWTFEEAVSIAERLREHGLAWLEEPIFPPDDYGALARLRGRCGFPIAAGENLGNAADLQNMLSLGAVDVVQPDVAKMGGVTAMRDALACATRMGVRLEPHSPLYGPALAATIHILAAAPESAWCEYYFADLEANPVGEAILPREGFILLPEGPGLGVEVDESVLTKYRIEGSIGVR